MTIHHLKSLVLIAVLVASAACSTSNPAEDSPWRANFFQNADRVWSAIQMSLIELDYDVEESDREDGTLRAISSKDDVSIALAIDQIQRTEDKINVFVRPADGGGAKTAGRDELDSAAEGFIKLLNSKLGG